MAYFDRSPEILADLSRSSPLPTDHDRSCKIKADLLRSGNIFSDPCRSVQIWVDLLRSGQISIDVNILILPLFFIVDLLNIDRLQLWIRLSPIQLGQPETMTALRYVFRSHFCDSNIQLLHINTVN